MFFKVEFSILGKLDKCYLNCLFFFGVFLGGWFLNLGWLIIWFGFYVYCFLFGEGRGIGKGSVKSIGLVISRFIVKLGFSYLIFLLFC